MSHPHCLHLVLILSVCLLATGCGEPQEIRTYTVDKRDHWKPRVALKAPEKQTTSPHQATPSKPLEYVSPDGWKPGPAVPFAEVSLVLTEGDKTATLTVSPMDASRVFEELYVNRWRGQVGLAPATSEQIESDRQKLKFGEAADSFFEFVGPEKDGPGETMFVTMQPRGSRVLITKLRAESKLAAQQKDAFMKFVQSLKSE